MLVGPSKMNHHSDNIKIELIVLVSDIEIALESKVNERLKNGILCRSITGDSTKRILILSHAIDIIDKKMYDFLVWLNQRRNEVAHNNPIDFDMKDLSKFEFFIDVKELQHLNTFVGSREDHYLEWLRIFRESFFRKIA
jgi:hypothetical protein